MISAEQAQPGFTLQQHHNMATHKIPSERGVRQLNFNDTAGEIWSSFNVDMFTNPGKIRLARPMKEVMDNTDLSSNSVLGMAVHGGGLPDMYVLTNADLYKDSSSPWTSFSVDDTTPTSEDSMTIFDTQLVIAGGTEIDAYDGTTYTTDWWGSRGCTALDNNYEHIMEVIRIGSETLAVTDGPGVKAYTGSISSGSSGSTDLDLDSDFVATCIKATVRKVFIGTYTETAEQAYVYEWDGASLNYTQAFPVGDTAVLAMEIVDNAPIIITGRGKIKIFNGAGFTTVAQFPFASDLNFIEDVEVGDISPSGINRPIHPQGLHVEGNTLFIYAGFVKNIINQPPADERTPAGIWALDLNTYSLTHLMSPGKRQMLNRVSPLFYVNDDGGRFFVGAEIRDAASGATPQTYWSEDLDDATDNCGYIVTTEIESNSVQDVFEEVIVKALLGTDDEIYVKYRTTNDPEYPITITNGSWTGTTTFTSTDANLATVKTRFDANTDGFYDEVEILNESGTGSLVHITNITESVGTYTITVDEAIGTNTEDLSARFDNWKKVPKTYTQSDGEYCRFGIGATGTWIQLKIEMRGKAGKPEIREVILHTNNKEGL